MSGTTYSWTNSNTSIGLAASGTGDISTFTATNTGTVPVSATISIIPTANGCTGTTNAYNIIVNPAPTVNTIANQAYCHNVTSPSTVVTGPVAGSAYTWTNSNTDIGLTSVGTGNVPSFTATNALSTPVSATISITPVASGCTGPVSTYTITVNPLPVPPISGTPSACAGTSGLVYTTDPGMTGYQWTVSGGGTITSGLGTNAATVTWNTIGPQSIAVNFTDGNGCTAAVPSTYNVSVQTLPSPTIATGASAVCAGQTVIYVTQPGALSYAWGYPASGVTKLSGGGSGDDFIELRWDVAGGYNISLNYSIGIGCTAVNPTLYPVTVNPNPNPVISGPMVPICGFSSQNYSTASVPGHTYAWSVVGGSPASATTPAITVLWGNTPPVSLDLVETAIYPGVSCIVQAATFIPVFKPWPAAAGVIAGPVSVCHLWNGQIYTVPVIANALSYEWNYTGTGATITNNGNSIAVNFSASATGGLLTVKGLNDCGYGPVSPPFAITVNQLPVVSYQLCNDAVTTKNAKPFILKGGIPRGTTGTYHLNNPSSAALTGDMFNPVSPAVLTGSNTIYYTYSDVNNCKATAQQTITVLPSNSSFPCLNLFTDPRDNSTYRTIPIGPQCWMQDNLRYGGTTVQYINPQTDNCVFERNCLPTDPSCTNNGGFYQWDEVMQYSGTDKAQGFCPPGWHIPNESEWDVMIANVSAGGGNGIAGSYMKDLLPPMSFKAIPAGITYLNNLLSFINPTPKATFFWTSTYDAAGGTAVARGLNTKNPSVSRYPSSRANAFPVRCIKD